MNPIEPPSGLPLAPLRRVLLPVITRKCGPCHACCVALPIRECDGPKLFPGGKPAGQPCGSLSGGRCGVYQTRPQLCAGFVCEWLAGRLPYDQRPDRTGLLLYAQDLGEPPGLGVVTTAREVWPGAAESPEARRVLLDESRVRLVFVYQFGQAGDAEPGQLLGPPEQVARIKAFYPDGKGSVDIAYK